MAIYNVKDSEMVSFSSNYNPTTTSLLDQLFPNDKTEDIKLAYLQIKKNPYLSLIHI